MFNFKIKSMFSNFFIQHCKTVCIWLFATVSFIQVNAQGGAAYGQLRSMTDFQPNIPMPSAPSAVGTGSSSSSSTYQMTKADYDRAYSEFLNETGNKINDKGVKFFNEKNYAKALRSFEKALKYLPGNAVIKKNIENTKNQLAYEKAAKERERYNEEMRKYNEKKQKELEEYNRKTCEKEISKAIAEIARTKKQISIIQTQLRSYNKELHNNSSEFEKWGKLSEEAYNNTISNSKDYIAQMFIKYGLLNALNPEVKMKLYGTLQKYLKSGNPAVQQWLLKQCTANNVDKEVMEGIVNGVLAGKDIAEMLTSDKPTLQKQLNGLLFINSFFESAQLVNYEQLLGEKFPGAPGDYFEQAKMIGETYCDLVSQCLSWYNINKLNNRTEVIAENVQVLSNNMQFQQKKLDCLQQCLENAVHNKTSKNCVNNCSGVSRLSSPVPAL